MSWLITPNNNISVVLFASGFASLCCILQASLRNWDASQPNPQNNPKLRAWGTGTEEKGQRLFLGSHIYSSYCRLICSTKQPPLLKPFQTSKSTVYWPPNDRQALQDCEMPAFPENCTLQSVGHWERTFCLRPGHTEVSTSPLPLLGFPSDPHNFCTWAINPRNWCPKIVLTFPPSKHKNMSCSHVWFIRIVTCIVIMLIF